MWKYIIKFCSSFIKWLHVKNIEGAVLLPFKLAIIAFIAVEIYDAIHYVACSIFRHQFSGFEASDIFACAILIGLQVLKYTIFIGYAFLLYRLIKWFMKKPDLWIAPALLFVLSLVVFWNLGSIAGVYFINGPYWGQVVDADTEKPIAGANVMAIWDIHFGAPTSTYTIGDARETITSANGWFFLPPGRRVWLWPFSNIELNELYVFKQGYDSWPSLVYRWSDEKKERRKKYLNNIEFITRIKDIKPYKKTLIQLYKALSYEEQKEATHAYHSDIGCDNFKIKRFLSTVKNAQNIKGKRKWKPVE